MKNKIQNTTGTAPKCSALVLAAVAIITLSACATSAPGSLDANDRNARIDAAMQRASDNAGTSFSLGTLERKYKRHPDDELVAAEYGAALRHNGYLEQADAILAPFAKDKTSSAAVKSEYAAIQLAQGNFKSAEKYAQSAILQDEGYFKAYHNLGIALDSQEMHKEAERAYRKGLELWQGDPTSIMNNLALNLATQEYLDEAAEILQKAKALSPDREEIERNLRIVTALQQTHGAPAPKPPKKPEI